MADAQTATTPKIDELRARLKADPKSRHFYPLAEELRKIQHFEEAEQILREGLQTHPAYLSAWISLGRVLRDRSRDHEAVEVLKRALGLDPGNVVAAKLLAQAYLGIGDKVEAIKKFKLVFAMMPSDQEVEQSIQLLDRELNPDKYPDEAAAVPPALPARAEEHGEVAPFPVDEEITPSPAAQPFAMVDEPSRFDSTDPVPFPVEEEPFGSTADSVLSSLVSSREEPQSEAPTSEEPLGFDAPGETNVLPFEAPPVEPEAEPFGDVASEVISQLDAPGVGGKAGEQPDFDGTQPHLEFPETAAPAVPATITMAQLYESQGHEQQAAQLYRMILEQQPDHEDARIGLSRIEGTRGGDSHAPIEKGEKIRRLEEWRTKVART